MRTSELCMRVQRANRVTMLITKLLAVLPIMTAAAASVTVHHSGGIMTPNKTITDSGDSQTLISNGRRFEMGFFSPNRSANRYLGIWFYNISVQTVVWVANRAAPLSSSDQGTLQLSPDGNLVLSNKHGRVFWSTGTSTKGTKPALRLMDSGNLVLINTAERSNTSIIWQSFDHPGDTFLSGMKVGVDYQHNISWQLTSWRSPSDPSPGDYCFKFSNYDVPQVHLWKGSHKIARFYGPWDMPQFVCSNGLYHLEFFRDASLAYYYGDVTDSRMILRVLLNATGSVLLFAWTPSSNEWITYFDNFPWDICDNYAICGANGICDTSYSSICRCLKGFVPKSPHNWNMGKYSDGCVWEAALKCTSADTFTLLRNMKVPDTENASSHIHMNLDECRDWCLRNCSCTAYAVLGATGCVIWHNNMYDTRESSGHGNDLYVRLLSSEKDSTNKKRLLVIILASAFCFLVFIGLLLCLKKRRKQKQAIVNYDIKTEGGDDVELPLYDMITILNATDDFSTHNILGKGGFGTVFKGKLGDGQEIAVKRLSKRSTQGLNEFKTEVNLIAKLQHRNLVQLLGYCIEGEERMLIYEYMNNGSLDAFILDGRNNALVTWQKCLDIIIGIARGLLYLHQDSRLKIIHRDLKPSNILLDRELNPKISDFGMARILKAGQHDEHTRKVVGTYGYMAPEYAMDGLFSEKSDVFSFGVIVLKILFAKWNKFLTQTEEHLNFIEHVWQLWKKDKGLELVEGATSLSFNYVPMVLKCIQIGLLCLEEKSKDRPTMHDVVLFLSDESIMLPLPKKPSFCYDDRAPTASSNAFPSNEVTTTMVEGR